MVAPNLPSTSAPTSPMPADIVLRGSGDTEIDKLIVLWLRVGQIDFEPYAEWCQSYMTEVHTLSEPRMIAGPSQMGSEDSMKDDTQLPQHAMRTDAVESQLVLRTKGLNNKDTPSPWGTKRYRDML